MGISSGIERIRTAEIIPTSVTDMKYLLIEYTTTIFNTYTILEGIVLIGLFTYLKRYRNEVKRTQMEKAYPCILAANDESVRLTTEEDAILRYAMRSYEDIFAGKDPLEWEYEWKDSEEGRVLSKIDDERDRKIDPKDKQKGNEWTRRLCARSENKILHQKIIRDFIGILRSKDRNKDNGTPLFQLVENNEGNVRLINIASKKAYHDKTMIKKHLEYMRRMCLLLLEGKESKDDMRKFSSFFTNLQEQIDQEKIVHYIGHKEKNLLENSEEIPMDHNEGNERNPTKDSKKVSMNYDEENNEEREEREEEKESFPHSNLYVIGAILLSSILLIVLLL